MSGGERVRRAIVWAPLVLTCAVALGRVVTASPPEVAPPSDDELDHRMFRAVASEETSMRHEAAKTFPTDLWSRDDDFHAREGQRARDWAGAHHVPTSAAFHALDEGLRAHWPHGNPGPLVPSTPPCRPRAIY